MKRKPDAGNRFLISLKNGFRSGLFTSSVLLKVMIPTMAAVWILKLAGVLEVVATITSSFMDIFHLPGEASLVLITGGLVNIYAAIAVAVNIPLTGQEMTVLAIMVLIAHNLLVETAVQSRAGTPAAIMLCTRLGAAISAGLIFARIIPANGDPVIRAGQIMGQGGWKAVLTGNAVSIMKIVVIILSLMVLMEVMREYGIMNGITSVLEKPIRALGMDSRTSFVAAVGLLLGIAYGAGIIIHETSRAEIGRKEILATNIFLGTNHALVEDSLILAAVGASLGWIILGRLVFGVVFLRLALPIVLFLWKPEGNGGI
jgi:spore maturation protein SpmB